MKFDPEKVLFNVRHADSVDLLERCTVFRDGMEPEALEIIEAELQRRGIGAETIDAHARTHPEVLRAGGLPLTCSFCHRAATGEAWGWHRLWGLVPVFPRKFRYCPDHEQVPLARDT